MVLVCAGQERLRMAETMVCVKVDGALCPSEIPPQLRETMQPYTADESEEKLKLRA